MVCNLVTVATYRNVGYLKALQIEVSSLQTADTEKRIFDSKQRINDFLCVNNKWRKRVITSLGMFKKFTRLSIR